MHRADSTERIGELPNAPGGLTTEEARRQLGRYGPNDILDAPAHAWRDLALDTARDPMLWFLLFASVLYGALGEGAESLTLLVSIVPLVGMDMILHRRTQVSTRGLRARLASRARVVRDSAPHDVPVEEVVPGDLARVAAGEYFPADGVLVGGTELQVDESALTGEAYPVRKRAEPELGARSSNRIGDASWGFAGTRLLTGEATLRVLWTGEATVYGEIVRSARAGSHARTPLQLAISQLVRVLLVAAVVLCAILALVRIRQGFGLIDALLSSLTLAVAALPEEFPVIFTMFLGVGAYRLARQKALVRRAVSVENIGRVSCICSDKTGTITQGQLQLTHWLPAEASGDEARLRAAAALASRRDSGDPMDEAIYRALDAEGVSTTTFHRLAGFPFTEDRRRETAIERTPDGLRIATKGAPETIFLLCRLSEPERMRWMRRSTDLARDGHKVIACATRSVPDAEWIGGEPDRDFELLGLLAFEDPVREGVPEAIARSLAAQIRVVMVTGDHPDTALAVARNIGLGGDAPRVILGEDFAELNASEQAETLLRVDVVARAVPSQKLAIVRAFQADGEIVAVTGDGVNDVPAIQSADIGIAMGERATRSAREVASIVLLDDNFRTIVRAIAEGRQLFENLRLSFQYLLLIHIPLVVTAALIPLAGYPILYLPIHIVWLELIIHPSAILAFQDSAPDGPLARRRTHTAGRFFTRSEWGVMGLVGTLVVGVVTFGYQDSLGSPPNVGHARAMALSVLSFASAGFVALLSRWRTPASRWITLLTLTSTAALVQVPALSNRLHMEPLHLADWGIALAGAALACLPLLVARRTGP